MVRLEILSGSRAGVCFTLSRFPIRVGRAPDNDVTLDEPGVWPGHFSIRREANDLVAQVGPDALISINGDAVQQSPLRNGDIITVGAIKLQFGFTAVRQSSLAWRERVTWAALAALAFGEVAVAYALR